MQLKILFNKVKLKSLFNNLRSTVVSKAHTLDIVCKQNICENKTRGLPCDLFSFIKCVE